MIDAKMWRDNAPDNRKNANRVQGKLEDLFDNDAENPKQDSNKTVELLNELDVLYCEAVLAILTKADELDDKKRGHSG